MRSMLFFIVMTFQFRQGCNRPMVYQISDGAIIEKITLNQLLSSNVNRESLAMYFASHILECENDLQRTYVVTLKSECRSNNLSVHHLNTTQEEADTHASTCHRCYRERSNIPLYLEPRYRCIGTGLMEVYKSLRRNFRSSWHRIQASINSTGSSVQRCRGSCCSGITRISRIQRL